MPRFMLLGSDDGVTPPTVVSSSQATTPANGASSAGGTTLVIPAPSGLEEGDVMLMVARWNGNPAITSPSGWSRLTTTSGLSIVDKKIATSSEPSEYTWSVANTARSRAGAIIAVRGANPDFGDYKTSLNSGLVLTDTTNTIENSLLVALGAADIPSTPPGTSFTSNSPLVQQIEHKARGSAILSIYVGVVIAVEESLPVGTISGRSFSNTSVGSFDVTAAAIVEGEE